MDIEKLKKLLIKHEGKVLLPYEDTEGYLTIGVGRNLEAVGITEDECELMLKNDIKRVLRDLRRIFENFDGLDENVQLALADMRFNLGPKGFRSFKKMIQAIKEGDYKKAAEEALNSKWAKQVKDRAEEIADLIRSAK